MNNFALIVLFGVVAVFFAGCKNDSIQFNADSKFSEVMKSIQGPAQPKVKKSSGVVIYRDESQQNKKQNSNSNFGPRDIIFDMPVK